MKQHTTPEQTAKLIELGFAKPRYATMFWRDNKEVTEINYTIGELIEMLPEYSDIFDLEDVETTERRWYVSHISTLDVSAVELIDALYEMIVKLKEKGVI